MFLKGLTVLILMIGLLSCSAESKEKYQFKTKEDSVSYSIGADIGHNFKQNKITVNVDAFKAGINDALFGDTTQLSQEQMQQVLMAFQQELRSKMMQERVQSGEENRKKGEEFLAANKSKPGIKVTESGLQYQVMKSGTGKTPKGDDKVKVNYKGTLISGKVFDQSKEPIEFPVNGVIKGWTEALEMMKVGDKWMIYVPSDLAYGEQGAGRDIGPNEVLIFEVELLEVNPGGTEAPTGEGK